MDINELKVVITAEISKFLSGINKVKASLNSVSKSKEFSDFDIDTAGIEALNKKLNETNEIIISSKKDVDALTSKLALLKMELKEATEWKNDLLNNNNTPFMNADEMLNSVKAAEEEINNIKTSISETNRELVNSKRNLRDYKNYAEEIKIKIKELKDGTKKTADATGGLKKELNSVLAVFKRMAIRRILRLIISSVIEMLKLLARFDSANNNFTGLNKTISDVRSQFRQLSANITTAAGVLISTFGPALVFILKIVNQVASGLTKIFAAFSGQTTYMAVNTDFWKDYAKELEAADKAQRQLIGGFDELNKFSSNNTNYATINPEDIYTVEKLDGVLLKVAETVKKIKGDFVGLFSDSETGEEIFSVLELAGTIGLVSAAVKLVNKLFKKKNNLLDEQTGKTDAETASVGALAGAFSALAIGAGALAGKLKGLFEKGLPELKPEIQLNPVLNTSAIPNLLSELKEKLKDVKLPELNPVLNVGGITSAISRIVALWAAVKLKELIPKVDLSGVKSGIAELGSSLNTFISDSRAKITIWASNFVSGVSTACSTAKNTISNWVSTTVSQISAWCTNTINNIKNWGTNVRNNIATSLSNTISNIKSWANTTATSVAKWCTNTATNIANWAKNVSSNVYNAINSVCTNIANFVNTTSSNFSKWCTNTASNIGKWASNIATNVGNALSSAWQSFKSFMTATGEKISGWFSANKPAITTVGISAAITAGIAALVQALPTIMQFAPLLLADGGVIDKPTYAMLGEYAGAKNNPEIAAPESKITELLNANNDVLLNGFAQMTRQVISAINGVDMTVSIGDDVIAKSAARGNNNYKRMTGNSLI